MSLQLTSVYGNFKLYGCNEEGMGVEAPGITQTDGQRRLTCPATTSSQARIEYLISALPAPRRHTLTMNGTISMVSSHWQHCHVNRATSLLTRLFH